MKNIIKLFKKPILLEQDCPGKYIPSGNIIDTGCLFPCTGIVIYNRKGRDAYAGHFSGFKIDDELLLKNILRESISKFGNSKDLEVFLVGCSENNGANRRKEELLFKLKEFGFSSSNIVHRWNPSHNFWSHMKFDVDTGKNEYVLYGEDGERYRGNIRNAPIYTHTGQGNLEIVKN